MELKSLNDVQSHSLAELEDLLKEPHTSSADFQIGSLLNIALRMIDLGAFGRAVELSRNCLYKGYGPMILIEVARVLAKAGEFSPCLTALTHIHQALCEENKEHGQVEVLIKHLPSLSVEDDGYVNKLISAINGIEKIILYTPKQEVLETDYSFWKYNVKSNIMITIYGHKGMTVYEASRKGYDGIAGVAIETFDKNGNGCLIYFSALSYRAFETDGEDMKPLNTHEPEILKLKVETDIALRAQVNLPGPPTTSDCHGGYIVQQCAFHDIAGTPDGWKIIHD